MSKTKPNWLFRVLVCISLGIHVVLFMHISGIYRSHALTYIELTLKDISKPPARSIPRPRLRPKKPRLVQEVKRLKITRRPIPMLKPIKPEPVTRDLPDSLVERISMPEMPAVSGLNLADWTPVKTEEVSDEYTTSNSYLEMVRLKIERHKKYPDIARTRQIEGRVTIRFVITPEGDIKGSKILKTSGHDHLDEAALTAVKLSAPFPKPPRQFFKGDITLAITVVFELT
jgi:periplasmic protein TonB